MAKNNYKMNVNQYANQEESIRNVLEMRSELTPALDCAIFSSSYCAGCECMLHSAPEPETEA